MAESKGPRKKGARVQSGPLKQTTLKLGSTSGAARSDGGAKPGGRDFKQTREASKLSYSEVKGDLFSCPDSFSLAHCVSEDMAMGAGVAVLFKEKFRSVGELKAQGVKPGGVAVLKKGNRFIYYLVTKTRFFHKPTYQSLHSSLLKMKEHCQANGVEQLAMPRIGAGLDKLSWDRVSEMIQDVFADLQMTITVYYL